MGLITYKHCLERVPLSSPCFNLRPSELSRTDRRPAHRSPGSPAKSTNLSSLPPELHHIIASHLPYPDLLALKLTSPYFSALVTPLLTVKARVNWVQARYKQNLLVPKSTRLSFKTDALFVANREVKAILRQRREHMECVRDAGVYSRAFTRTWRHPSDKVCLVTMERKCPRIQRMEDDRKRYEESFVGKLTMGYIIRNDRLCRALRISSGFRLRDVVLYVVTLLLMLLAGAALVTVLNVWGCCSWSRDSQGVYFSAI